MTLQDTSVLDENETKASILQNSDLRQEETLQKAALKAKEKNKEKVPKRLQINYDEEEEEEADFGLVNPHEA